MIWDVVVFAVVDDTETLAIGDLRVGTPVVTDVPPIPVTCGILVVTEAPRSPVAAGGLAGAGSTPLLAKGGASGLCGVCVVRSGSSPGR